MGTSCDMVIVTLNLIKKKDMYVCNIVYRVVTFAEITSNFYEALALSLNCHHGC